MNTKITLSTLAIALCACSNVYAWDSNDLYAESLTLDATNSHACAGKFGYYETTRRMLQIVGGKLVSVGGGSFQMSGGKLVAINGGNGIYFYGTNNTPAPQFDPNDGYTVIRACTNDKTVLATVPYKDDQTDVKTDVCPEGSTGSITKKRTYTLWSDGLKSDFTIKLVNNCVALTSEIKTQTAADSCPEGQIGRIDKSRTFSYFTDGTSKDFSDWKITGNSCVDVPKETVTPYHFEVTCDSYYGSAKGSYTGMVMKSGNNVTNGAGETTFHLISTDTTSCAKAFSDEKEVITEEACPAGQTGTRIMSVMTAENGSGTVYPNGSTPIEKSNTCVSPLDSGSVNNPESETQDAAKSAVLSNMSFTVSQLSKDGDLLADQISQFDSSKAEGTNTFNIVANSLNAKTLNPTNVTKVIKAYKKASGDNSVVKVGGLSQSLYDYVGQGGLTAQKIADEKLVMLSSKEDSGVVTVKYASYKNQMKPGEPQSFSVKIYNQ